MVRTKPTSSMTLTCETSESYTITGCFKNFFSAHWLDVEWSGMPGVRRTFQCVEGGPTITLWRGLWKHNEFEITRHCKPNKIFATLHLFTDSQIQVGRKTLSIRFSSSDAELGGALGLFLGFSFMMVCDALELLLKYCLKNKDIV